MMPQNIIHQYKNDSSLSLIIIFYTTAIAGDAPETKPGLPPIKVVTRAKINVACKPLIGGTPANILIATPSGICVKAIDIPDSISLILFLKSL